MTPIVIKTILVIIVSALLSAFLYNKWLQSEKVRKDKFSKHIHCVTKGDMYCSHDNWCDAEIALYPEDYEAEMNRKENDKNKDQ